MSDTKALSLIVAMDRNRVIGNAGEIPWHHREDMRYFRRVTAKHAVIMGRGTYDSIGKPLAKRRNIVVSRRPGLQIPGCEVVTSVAKAIALAHQADAEPMVIGGAQIYAEALPRATRIYLTEIPDEHPGDTFFPALDSSEWRETDRRQGELVTWLTLERTTPDQDQPSDS